MNSESTKKRNGTAILLHFVFKVMAILSYFFCMLIFNSFICMFICVTVSQAFDFWIVKNISGRLLVGMRWWQTVNQEGNTEIQFEKLEDTSSLHSVDKYVFWYSTYGIALFWVLVSILNLTNLFTYFPLCILSAVLSMTNVLRYTQCYRQGGTFSIFTLAKEKMQTDVGLN